MDVNLIYILHENASKNNFNIKGDLYKYLVKVRRHNIGDTIDFRTKTDINTLHTYTITNIGSKGLDVERIASSVNEVQNKKSLHIAWCVIDAKSIEKVLPSLNEIGVEKISFIYCERSQKNFKLDFQRFERILESSMQQCGRTSFMKLDTYKSVKDFLAKFPDTKVFDFCDKVLSQTEGFNTVLIGCEGGFSKMEREYLSAQEVFRLNTSMVLRSETAVMAVASKVLL
ncbi:16S rRNA (uracil(1498)-N(3))-methyltransferase [bacterium]|nr:16S rRNA (uracil(1498)-N(3))-methyltransferase [bacterium]MBU1993245.1 16S rRNA (uracil(1498)-N(3))-methyltransferase [bacterium]